MQSRFRRVGRDGTSDGYGVIRCKVDRQLLTAEANVLQPQFRLSDAKSVLHFRPNRMSFYWGKIALREADIPGCLCLRLYLRTGHVRQHHRHGYGSGRRHHSEREDYHHQPGARHCLHRHTERIRQLFVSSDPTRASTRSSSKLPVFSALYKRMCRSVSTVRRAWMRNSSSGK